MLCIACFTTMCAQQLDFRQKSINMGIMSEDDAPKTFHFAYMNESDNEVKILKVETTCGCARPQFKKQAIRPQEKGSVSVTFYPLGRAGEVCKSIFVYTDTITSKAPIELTLVGKVTPSTDPYINYPYAIGPLRLMQSTIHFHQVKQRQMVCVEVINSGTKSLTLSTTGLPPYISFLSQPTAIAPKEKAELMFIIYPEKMKQKGEFKCDFLLEGVGDYSTLQRTMTIMGNVVK